MARPLDHVVINSHARIDAAAAQLRALGFTLTPQGRHPMGSLNHLAVLQDNYLELIGLPTDGGPIRQELLDNPVGTDGLVFHAHDAPSLHAQLVAQGEPVQPVQAFERPIELDGRAQAVRFRAVRYQPGRFSAGRVYFCEHLSPELVWRPEWQAHPNTAQRLTGVVVVAEEPVKQARAYAAASGWPVRPVDDGLLLEAAGERLRIMAPDAYQRRYGDWALPTDGRDGLFGAIEIAVADGRALQRWLAEPPDGVRTREQAGHWWVRLTEFNSLLDFHVHE